MVLAMPLAMLWTVPITVAKEHFGVDQVTFIPLMMIATHVGPTLLAIYCWCPSGAEAAAAPKTGDDAGDGKKGSTATGATRAKGAKGAKGANASKETAPQAANVAEAVEVEAAPWLNFCLFLVPVCNAVYFSLIFWRFEGKIDPTLYFWVVLVSALSLVGGDPSSSSIS
jgi:hypothetical protein